MFITECVFQDDKESLFRLDRFVQHCGTYGHINDVFTMPVVMSCVLSSQHCLLEVTILKNKSMDLLLPSAIETLYLCIMVTLLVIKINKDNSLKTLEIHYRMDELFAL